MGKIDHSSAGALHAVQKNGPIGKILAYLIAGHHAGLPDWHHEQGVSGALSERLENLGNLQVAQLRHPFRLSVLCATLHPSYLFLPQKCTTVDMLLKIFQRKS